jgi:esterase
MEDKLKAVKLEHVEWGSGGLPLVVLHGLLGSSRNWQRAGVLLGPEGRVCALDLRNHGRSPHAPEMSYAVMAADVAAWLKAEGIERCHLLGHSMGGKVAMWLATEAEPLIASLTVVDIAPRAYAPRWEKEFAHMRRMPVERMKSRAEAEAFLEEAISDWAFRKFLVSNLERMDGGGFRWIVNLAVLEASLPALFRQVPETGLRFNGPTLFLRGERSRFVEESDTTMIQSFFPEAQLMTIAEAGHNVHFDQPERFAEAVRAHACEGRGSG